MILYRLPYNPPLGTLTEAKAGPSDRIVCNPEQTPVLLKNGVAERRIPARCFAHFTEKFPEETQREKWEKQAGRGFRQSDVEKGRANVRSCWRYTLY
jgi:hypothetical protein